MNVTFKNNLFTLVGYNAGTTLAVAVIGFPVAVVEILSPEIASNLRGETGFGLFAFPFVIAWIVLLSAGYIAWGYLTLEPRPKGNFWSVSFLPLAALPFVLMALTISIYTVRCFAFLFIVPLLIPIILSLNMLQSTALYDTSEGALLVIALVTYLPALCMYLGLCLKIWRRRTSSNGQTLPEEETSEVTQHDC